MTTMTSEQLQTFYDDLFEDLPDYWEIYFEIWRCLHTYGEWPCDESRIVLD